MGALGIVFGDIGTSPLYAFQAALAVAGDAGAPTLATVYGMVSLIFWAITVVVAVKYVTLVMRADNEGEGGVMSLSHLVRGVLGARNRPAVWALLLGVIGAALFYGDSVITPAISVLAAVEGLEVIEPGLVHLVVPITLVILTALFAAQRWGTAVVGRAFGPVMLVWFATLALIGLPHLVAHPGVVRALLPSYAAVFLAEQPAVGFAVLGAVVLAVTGAEAIYADMGHFGRAPIRRAWFVVVFPALTINYLAQAQVVLDRPGSAGNPFFALAPHWGRIPLLVLATAATVIASQAVISGAFSVTRQCQHEGVLPRLRIQQTSASTQGQIYVPVINWLLLGLVVLVVLIFGSSSRLATAYGIAVTGTFLVTTVLFLTYARLSWGWRSGKILAVAVLVGIPELVFFTANLTKFPTGGWLPVVVALVVGVVMWTWWQGQEVLTQRRSELERNLVAVVAGVHTRRPTRVPGTAIYLHPNNTTAPLGLERALAFSGVLHQHVLIVTVDTLGVPWVHHRDRASYDPLGQVDDDISHVRLRFGYQQIPDVPVALQAVSTTIEELDLDMDHAFMVVSRMQINLADHSTLGRLRGHLFVFLSRNATDPTHYYALPHDRTLVVGAEIDI